MKVLKKIYRRGHFPVSVPKIIPLWIFGGIIVTITTALPGWQFSVFNLQFLLPPAILKFLFEIDRPSSPLRFQLYSYRFPAGKGRCALSAKQLLDAILVWKPP